MVGVMGLVATAATGLSTVTAVVTRVTARKEQAKAEAAAKAAEALTAELLGHDWIMQVFLGGTTAFSLASVVGVWQAKKRISELDLGSQVRDLRAHALSGRLANQERQSAIRVAGLQDALDSSRVQAIRAAEVHRQVVERCHRERVAGESQRHRERAEWASELHRERVAVQRMEMEAAAAQRELEKAQRRANEAVELRRKHAAMQQEEKARQRADEAVELRQERAAVQRAENKAAATQREVDKARRRADEAVEAAEACRKDRAETAVQVSQLRRKLLASEEAERRSQGRIVQVQQQHILEVSELKRKLLASEEAERRSQERIQKLQQQRQNEKLSEQDLKLDRLPSLVIPETGFLDKTSAGVEGCTAYVGGVVVLHRGDGNCRFSSEIDSALMVAAQDPTKLKEFEGKVAVVTSTSTYKNLQPKAKNHVKSFVGFVVSLGKWWEVFSGEKEHVGAWLAAEALSALAHEEEGAKRLASGRLDAKLAESVSTQVAREARGRFESVVKRSDYHSLYKGAAITARICEMVHLQDESRPTELVDQARHVNRFYDFDPYAWIPGDSLSVPVGFLGEGWNARRKAISFTAYDAVGNENADKTVQVFKREGWHFDVLVDDDSLLAGMITARNKLAAPHDPDVFRKEMEKAHGVRQETAGDEALAAKLAAEMMDGGGTSYAERERAAFVEFSGGRQSEQPADVGGIRMAGGGPDGNTNRTGFDGRRTNGCRRMNGQAAAAVKKDGRVTTKKLNDNASTNTNTNANATAGTTGGRGGGRGGGKGGGGRGARSRRRK